jgi:hypothetical protein
MHGLHDAVACEPINCFPSFPSHKYLLFGGLSPRIEGDSKSGIQDTGHNLPTDSLDPLDLHIIVSPFAKGHDQLHVCKVSQNLVLFAMHGATLNSDLRPSVEHYCYTALQHSTQNLFQFGSFPRGLLCFCFPVCEAEKSL